MMAAGVANVFETRYTGRRVADIHDATFGEAWHRHKGKSPWTFELRLTCLDAAYFFHYDPGFETFYIAAKVLKFWQFDAGIVVESGSVMNPEVWDYVYVRKIYEKNRTNFKQGLAHWKGYMPRAMLLIQWLAVNLGVSLIRLIDGWKHVMDPHILNSSLYKQAFHARLHHLAPPADVAALSPPLKEKLESDYTDAQEEGTVDAVIDAGYYGRFGFYVSPTVERRLEVKPLEMKGTRSMLGYAYALDA